MQLAEIALANAVVSMVRVEVVRAAVNVNMLVGGKVVCIALVCPVADASWAVAEVVLEMKMGGALEAGESGGDDD